MLLSADLSGLSVVSFGNSVAFLEAYVIYTTVSKGKYIGIAISTN
jgi:hypothetical protein